MIAGSSSRASGKERPSLSLLAHFWLIKKDSGMAAPSLNLRISPSGTLAGPEASIPLEEMAGLLLWTPGDGANSYRNAIGPSDAAAANLGIEYYRADGPSSAGGTFNTQPLAVQDDATPFGLSAGTWRVRTVLTMGFNTSIPLTPTYGALVGQVAALNDAGVPQVTGDLRASPIPKDITIGIDADHSLPGVAHGFSADLFLIVTPAMVAGNGDVPLPGLSLQINRISSTEGGAYDTTSGWLEFTHDAHMVVSRYR